jgi:hypothetical protein
MYVCPSCSEEIPDRVKKRSEECPFCHTPWPPDEVAEPDEPEAEPEAAKPEGWGDEFKPSASPSPEALSAAAEPEKKSKLGLIIAIAVVVLGGGGAGLYFGVLKGDDEGKKGAGKKGKQGVSEGEFTEMQKWYKDARKVLFSYMDDTCRQYYNSNYEYHSFIRPVKSVLKRGGKEVELLTFNLELKPDPKAKPQGKPNLWQCPYKLAQLHHDHPFVMEAKVWERKQVFGAVLKYADIEIKGKLTGYLKKKKFRSLASQTHKGFAFSGLKKSEDPGLKALAQPLPFKMAKDIKSFKLANLKWEKTEPGKYIIGTWRLELTSPEIRKKYKDWANACVLKRRQIGKLGKAEPNHEAHQKLRRTIRDSVKNLCKGLEQISKSLEPWKKTDIEAANSLIQQARKTWNQEAFGMLEKAGKKLDLPVTAKKL